MRKAYFENNGGPEPLRAFYKRHVRFEDCDPMGIMWHGRYPSFLEDAREALGRTYGISYLDFYKHGITLPIKNIFIDYLAPLKYKGQYTTNAILHWADSARLNIEYAIYDVDNILVTKGYSIQLLLSLNGVLLLESPDFYKEFKEKWKNGQLEPNITSP